MAASIFFLLISLVLLTIVLVKAGNISRKLDRLQNLVENLNKKIDKQEQSVGQENIQQISVKEELENKVQQIPREVQFKEAEEKIEEKESAQKIIPAESIQQKETVKQPITQPQRRIEKIRKPVEKKPKSNLSRDWEKFIGENLMSKIGIAILVLGIGFFVKYAIDKEWVNEYGRVAIGYLSGAILISVAHFLRKNYKTFSSILIGGGFAIFYITTALGFRYYDIFSQSTAFIIAVVTTLLAVFFSLAYDKRELAVLSILGGFVSPLMLSTGEGNYKILFTYILILDLGMLVLAYFKKWNVVTIVSYICTVLLFAAWSVSNFISSEPHYIPAFAYGTAFYFIFFVMTILNNLVENKKFKAFDISILLSNTFLYFGLGLSALGYAFDNKYNGIFTIALALLNMGFSLFLYKKEKIDKNLIYLLIALVLTFITLAGPIQLHGNYITLFWAAEACILFWFSKKSGIEIAKHVSAVIVFLAFTSLLMDWEKYDQGYDEPVFPIIFNKICITSIVVAGALFLKQFLLKGEEGKILGMKINVYKVGLAITSVIVLYLGLMIEISYQSDERLPGVAEMIYPIAFHLLFCLAMFWISVGKFKPLIKTSYWINFSTIILFIIIAVPLTYLIATSSNHSADYLPYSWLQFSLFLAIAGSLIVKSKSIIKMQKSRNLLMWFYAFFLTIAISTQLDYTLVMIDGSTGVLKHSHRIGYPILWSLSSFVIMYIGMKIRNKNLRIISISLFGLVLLKLFLYDVWKMDEAGKIIAFIILGVILLIISFLYQKLKKILIDNESDSTAKSITNVEDTNV